MSEMHMSTVNKTLEALRKNNMQAYFCATAEEVPDLVRTLINKGDIVTHGGSVTLAQTGITKLLSGGDYCYLDRNAPGLTREQVQEIYLKAFTSDVYFTSSNAITENGELYNVDGNSNRVAAMIYGPKSVIVIAGYNKIVSDLNTAITRVKCIAAPQNTQRLNCDTYCAKTGKCVSFQKKDSLMCDGCLSEQRICCSYTVIAQQRHKDRIKVIIVGEKLGY